MLETEGHSFNEKIQMKPHTNYDKSLHSMKVGFVSYAWNLFKYNAPQVYNQIWEGSGIKYRKETFLLCCMPLSYGNYKKLYQILPQEAVIQNTAWLLHGIVFWDDFCEY